MESSRLIEFQGGKYMRVKKLRHIKCLVFAVMMCVMSIAGLKYYKDISAAMVVPTIGFDMKTDTLSVKSGTTGYYFYTTANASRAVPAAQKWVKTNSGSVDVSYFTSGKTLYFAMSTTPQLDDIVTVKVPASPRLSKAVYNGAAENLNSMFTFYMKLSVSTYNSTTAKTVTKAQNVVIPHTRIEVKVNDNSAWTAFNTAITEDTLPGLQKEGAVIYARIAPSTKTTVTDADSDGIYAFTDAGTTQVKSLEEGVTYNNTDTIARYGIAKTLKIAKVSGGPAIVINYADHSMSISKGQAFGSSTATYTEPASFESVTDVRLKKKYFGNNGTVKATEYYGVKTAATANKADSLTTFVMVPATTLFADTGSSVAVQGGYKEAARMTITSSEAKKNIAYQYAIVDLSNNEVFGGLITTGVFDYSNTNVKWVTIKTNVSGVASASLPWAKVDGKQIVVRKAAAGTTYSSGVEVLNAPTGTGLPSYTAGAEYNTWSKLTQATYGTGFISTNKNIKFCTNITASEYDASNMTLTFYALGSTVTDAKALSLKVGKKVYPMSATSVTATDVPIKSGSATVGHNIKITVKLSAIEAFPASNSNSISIVCPAGMASDMSGYPSLANTTTIKIDNQLPKLLSTVVKKSSSGPTVGNIVLTFDSELAINGTKLASGDKVAASCFTVAASADKSVAADLDEAIYTYSSKTKRATITIPYTISSIKYPEFTVKFKTGAFKDPAGNLLAATDFTVNNPAYQE